MSARSTSAPVLRPWRISSAPPDCRVLYTGSKMSPALRSWTTWFPSVASNPGAGLPGESVPRERRGRLVPGEPPFSVRTDTCNQPGCGSSPGAVVPGSSRPRGRGNSKMLVPTRARGGPKHARRGVCGPFDGTRASRRPVLRTRASAVPVSGTGRRRPNRSRRRRRGLPFRTPLRCPCGRSGSTRWRPPGGESPRRAPRPGLRGCARRRR